MMMMNMQYYLPLVQYSIFADINLTFYHRQSISGIIHDVNAINQRRQLLTTMSTQYVMNAYSMKHQYSDNDKHFHSDYNDKMLSILVIFFLNPISCRIFFSTCHRHAMKMIGNHIHKHIGRSSSLLCNNKYNIMLNISMSAIYTCIHTPVHTYMCICIVLS